MSEISRPQPRVSTHRPRRWLLAEGAARTWRLLADDFMATPRPARARMMWILTWGLAASVALMLGACWLVRRWERAGLLAWEAQMLRDVEARGPLSFSAALWAESPGNSVFMIPVVACVTLLCIWLRRPLHAVAVLASFFFLDLIVLAGWTAWDRARPDLIASGIAAPGFHSFPSGHMAQMVSVYGLFTWFWLRKSRSALEHGFAILLLVAVCAVVALSRLRLGSHWPSDVVAGVGIGALWLVITVTALKQGEARGGR